MYVFVGLLSLWLWLWWAVRAWRHGWHEVRTESRRFARSTPTKTTEQPKVHATRSKPDWVIKEVMRRKAPMWTKGVPQGRPHQNADGLATAQKWNGLCEVDVLQQLPKSVVVVQALDGLLVGYCKRR